MRLGVVWYPEQHDPAGWPEDVARMRDAGLELVRLGEFAWATLEPARGDLHWAWLDRAIDAAAAAGLEVVLGTPTAVAPVWLALERPDILSVGEHGRRRAYGTRRHTCLTSPAYREESARIVGLLVERYGGHPAIATWQLDNEVGNHDSARCWCAACEAAFTVWLRARYGTVERLNEAWGTAFWSGAYPTFEAVRLPVPTMTPHAPSLLLAHRRFASAQAVAFLEAQRAIVAAGAPGRAIVANEYWDDRFVDPRAVARLGGIAAIDAYPHGVGSADELELLHDLAVGHTGRAWVIEHQAGPINWAPLNPPVPPGRVRDWGWLAALHGHEVLAFFSWQPTRSGQEQQHSGLLRHDGTADRGLDEVRRLAAELRDAPAGTLARPPARVAVLWDVEDAWALEIVPHRTGLRHADLVLPAHGALRRLGLEVDVVGSTADLRGYAAVLAPAVHLVTPARLESLRAALEAGVLVVLGPRSLVRDAEANHVDVPLPSGFAPDLGTRVLEGLSQTLPVTVEVHGRTTGAAGPWTDVLEEPAAGSGARVLARYAGGTYLDGAPAAVARGGLAYVGASDGTAWVAILRALLGGRLELDDIPAGTARFRRAGGVIDVPVAVD